MRQISLELPEFPLRVQKISSNKHIVVGLRFLYTVENFKIVRKIANNLPKNITSFRFLHESMMLCLFFDHGNFSAGIWNVSSSRWECVRKTTSEEIMFGNSSISGYCIQNSSKNNITILEPIFCNDWILSEKHITSLEPINYAVSIPNGIVLMNESDISVFYYDGTKEKFTVENVEVFFAQKNYILCIPCELSTIQLIDMKVGKIYSLNLTDLKNSSLIQISLNPQNPVICYIPDQREGIRILNLVTQKSFSLPICSASEVVWDSENEIIAAKNDQIAFVDISEELMSLGLKIFRKPLN